MKKSDKMEPLILDLLKELGEDPGREGLQKTPARVARAMRDFTRGYGADIGEIINGALYEVEYNEMVLVRDIDFFSLCEHHLVPFFGKCHVAYVPDKKIVGLSKIPRIVDAFARRLQVQERLTSEVADCLNDALKPKGVGVVMEALHLCMAMRGVEKQNAVTVTNAMRGSFLKRPETRAEFLNLVRGRFEGL
jgi:GTP cyclohydrolase IA